MEIVAQLVRAPDCGSGGHGFKPRLSPQKTRGVRIVVLEVRRLADAIQAPPFSHQ